MLEMQPYAQYLARESFEKNVKEENFRQPRATKDPQNYLSLTSSDSGLTSTEAIDDADSTNMMNDATSVPVTPALTLEDCREALKKYPNHSRLILQQNKETGKISMVGSSCEPVIDFFTSQEEAQENRVTLQAVKNLIAECAKSYGTPSIDWHPHLLHLIDFGRPLTSETLRRILFHTTGTIHGIKGEPYEYQATLADPKRNAIPDLAENFVHPDDIAQPLQKAADKVKEMVSQVTDAISTFHPHQEKEGKRYKEYALRASELIPFAERIDETFPHEAAKKPPAKK